MRVRWQVLVLVGTLALVLDGTSRASEETLQAEGRGGAPTAGAATAAKPAPPAEPPPPADARLEPFAYRESEGEECRSFHGRSFCDGPRRVPVPHGAPAELARSLGIEERRAGREALHGPVPEAWVEAVEGDDGEGLLWPVPEGRLLRGFGNFRELVRRGPGVARGRRRIPHPGVDIGAPPGSPIRAVDDGLVLYSYNGLRGFGNSLVLLHPDGTVTLYAHCQATYAFAGQRVRRGQIIGEVGSTGLAHGPHLHFEWRDAGEPLDPAPHFVEVPQREAPESPRRPPDLLEQEQAEEDAEAEDDPSELEDAPEDEIEASPPERRPAVDVSPEGETPAERGLARPTTGEA